MIDYMYTADINPAEREMNVKCVCAGCWNVEFRDMIVEIRHSYTIWDHVCPRCGAHNTQEVDNEKLFD